MNNCSPITVGFTIDENYVQHLYVAMLSILLNKHVDVPIHFFVICHGLSIGSLDLLTQLANENNASIGFSEMRNSSLKNIIKLSQPSHVSRATCGRLAISELVNIDKIILLDCDLLFMDDIEKLWNIDISHNYAGAVLDDPPIHAFHWHKEHCKKIGMPPGANYYNTGVLLLNLKKCRQNKVIDNAIQFMIKNIDQLCYPDQDGLNVAMGNNWLTIHPRWNVQTSMFNNIYKGNRKNIFPSDIIEALQNPAVVHFTEDVKPWHYQCENPYVKQYYNYLSLTPWKNYKPTGWTFRGMIRKNRRLFKRRLKSRLLGYPV